MQTAPCQSRLCFGLLSAPLPNYLPGLGLRYTGR